MQIKVTFLQMLIIKALREKPLKKEQIGERLDKNSKGQTAQAIRYLVDEKKINHDNGTYSLIDGVEYTTENRIKKMLNDEPQNVFIPEIKVYEPDELTKMDVLKLHKQGYTRTEIAKRLKLTKMMVLWTLCNNVEERRQAPDADAIYVDDVQARVYRVMLRQITQLETIADRAKISRQECEIILRELIDMGAVVIQRTKYGLAYFQVECNLIPNRKRSKVANAN